MVAHAGDMSNLILDPDLDSYYLMDVTLLAIPQTLDRLGAIGRMGMGRKPLSATDREALRLHAAMLREADLARVLGSLATALNEDHNAYGVSDNLQTRIPPGMAEYKAATEKALEVFDRVAAGREKPGALTQAAGAASVAAGQLGMLSLTELDALLDIRIRHYERSLHNAIAVTCLALLLPAALAFWIIRAISQLLGRVVRSMSEHAALVTTTCRMVTQSSQQVASGANVGAASLEETSSSLTELSCTTRMNVENSAAAKEWAAKSRQAVECGVAAMREMGQSMHAIKTSADGISRIIKSIDDIAFQTNILALNAAVESARAGEAGLGFAVVAGEVRNLAQRSAQAARETAERIQDSVQKSEDGMKISLRVEEIFTQTEQMIRSVDDLMQQIASANQEQQAGFVQIGKAVEDLASITQSTATEAGQSTRTLQELTGKVGELKDLVEELAPLAGMRAS
jgi:methyl-accepting chemotaxis protein